MQETVEILYTLLQVTRYKIHLYYYVIMVSFSSQMSSCYFFRSSYLLLHIHRPCQTARSKSMQKLQTSLKSENLFIYSQISSKKKDFRFSRRNKRYHCLSFFHTSKHFFSANANPFSCFNFSANSNTMKSHLSLNKVHFCESMYYLYIYIYI